MKTFVSDIISKLQRYSQKLDNITLLTNQHWVVVDETIDSKHVYIFRSNGELIISQNGRVEKAKWEYLGHDTLLIDRKDESLLFRHGFFDENVLALKIDGTTEYIFLVNDDRFSSGLNTPDKILDFLNKKYFSLLPDPQPASQPTPRPVAMSKPVAISKIDLIKEYGLSSNTHITTHKTSIGVIQMYRQGSHYKVFLNGTLAPTGKYKLGFLYYINVKDGILVNDTLMGAGEALH